jgi:hypothetical protein
MLERLLSALLGDGAAKVTRHEVMGIPVVVENTRPDIDTRAVIARLERTLALIQQYVPHHSRHQTRFRSHHRRGSPVARLSQRRACLVELTFSVNPDFTDAKSQQRFHEATRPA